MSAKNETVGSLLTIGDEILCGDIANGNAHHIASKLHDKGFRLDGVFAVGDREEDIGRMLLQCMGRSDFLIVTGGLGPTDDDRTNAAVSATLGLELTLDAGYLEWLREQLARRGHQWTPEVEKLAELPVGALKLGIQSAGYFLEHGGLPCYFLPGVPYEMRDLMQRYVLPDLERRFPKRPCTVKRILRLQELFESEIGHRLKQADLIARGVEVGYYPQVREIWLKLSTTADNRQEAVARVDMAEKEVLDRIGRHHFSGYEDNPLEKLVGIQLMQRNWKLALAESCTGGLISRQITSISGSSDYFDRGFVTYSNQAKMELLGVSAEILEAHGAVSGQTAEAMARGARTRAPVDIALAVTGIAGPTGGSPQKPVGTVFMACAFPDDCTVEQHLFHGDRDTIQQMAAHAALVLLWKVLSR